MSIIVKGMKMPENCHECEFVDILPTCPCNKMADDDFWNNVSLAVEGHKDCPLLEVPPHGRLIDADALLKLLDSCMFPSDMVTTRALSMATNWLKEAPTIIEAEE